MVRLFARIVWLLAGGSAMAMPLLVAPDLQFNSGANRAFHIGDGVSPDLTIYFSCHQNDISSSNPAGGIRFTIPTTTGIVWNTGDTSITASDPGAANTAASALSATIQHLDSNRTMRVQLLNPGNFTHPDDWNITGFQLNVPNTASPAPPFNLRMHTLDVVAQDHLDSFTIRVADIPSVATTNAQTMSPGQPSVPCGPITIREMNSLPFNGGIWQNNGSDFGIRLTIPSTAGVTWNTGSVVSCTGAAVTNNRMVASPTVSYEDSDRTIRISVDGSAGTDFAQNEDVIISGLLFNVSSSAPDNTFQVGVRTGLANNQTIHRNCTGGKTVEGEPTLSSVSGQIYTSGDPSTLGPDIIITENPGSPKLNQTNDITIVIPDGLGMTFNTAVIPSAVASGAGSGTVGVPSFPNNKTMFIPVTADFVAPRIVTISNVRYTNFDASSSGQLQLLCDPVKADPDALDDKIFSVAHPTLSSAVEQVFLISPPGPAAVDMATITITDDATNPRIAVGTQFRIVIPAGFNMNWEGTDFSANVTGKLSATVSYPGGPGTKTLLVTANGNFNPGESATIFGLRFVGFAAPSSPNFLQLFMHPSGTVSDSDNELIAVGGLPTMSSGTNQEFTLNDPTRLANPIVITEHSVSPSLQTGNTIEIVIPGGLNMVFDTGFLPSATPGAGTLTPPPPVGTVGAPSFFNNRTLRIPITETFQINQTLTISGARFTSFLGSSGPLGLQLRVTVGGPVAATDNRTKAIGAPTIASAANQSFGVNDGVTNAQNILITEDATTRRLLNGTTLRVRIPSGFNMVYDTGAPVIGTPGPATIPTPPLPGTVGTLTFFDNKTLEIPITRDFHPGQTLLISGARFQTFSAISGTDNLELEVNLSGVANNTDTSSIRIGTRPTVSQIRTADSNANGSIDQIVVTFSENINPATTSATTGLGFSLPGYTIALGSGGANVVTFTLNETGNADTGATPTLTYNPAVGNFTDANDTLELNPAVSPFPATVDGAAPILVGFATSDGDANGFLNQIVFTFSENLNLAQADIADWRLVDADGTTNLLGGLTTANVGISANQVTITLGNTLGTTGIPRFRYLSDGLLGTLRDLASPPNNVPFQTNNTRPIAAAGIDQSVAPSRVTLDGSGSFDPDGQPVAFSWIVVSIPPGAPAVTLAGPTTSKPTFLVRKSGVYTFQLSITDGLDTTNDQTLVTVLNVPPSPVALFDQVAGLGTPVTLNARFSSDANTDPLTFSWAQIPTPPTPGVAITNALTSTANFTPLVGGIYRFQVSVMDGVNTSLGFVTVIVNGANGIPRSNAGPDQLRPVGSLVKLDGGLSADPDGNPLSFAWTPAGQLSNPAAQSPTFVPPLPGIYTFELVVTDSLGASSLPSITKILAFDPANRPPTAFGNKLSPPGNPVVGDVVTLDATGSIDPEGAPLQFSWSQVSGPFTVLANPSTVKPTFTPVTTGDYVFQVIVSDGAQQSFPVRVFIQIRPSAGYVMPFVTAQLANDPDADGRVATAPVQIDVTGVGFTTGPVEGLFFQVGGTPVVTSDPFVSPLDFTPLVAGVYRFNVLVIEGTGLTAQQRVEAVFDNASNSVPTANAGVDLAADTGETVTLSAVGSSDSAADLDGVVDFNSGLRPYWQQIAGPVVPLSDPFTAQPTFVPTLPGSYVFALVVSDGKAASATDTVAVLVTGTIASGTTSGGSSGGCGMGAEALVLVGLLTLTRRLRR